MLVLSMVCLNLCDVESRRALAEGQPPDRKLPQPQTRSSKGRLILLQGRVDALDQNVEGFGYLGRGDKTCDNSADYPGRRLDRRPHQKRRN